MPELTLKAGRERSILRRHPWIFSGAVDHITGSPSLGETVEIHSSRGEFLGRAAYNPNSQITARIWSFDNEPIETGFFEKRLKSAIFSRQQMGLFQPGEGSFAESACRLVHGESDGLPGLVVDQYADCLVVQFLSAGVDAWKATIADILVQVTGIPNLYERSDVDVRALEGLPVINAALRGSPQTGFHITENRITFSVDIAQGHKTGFYLDQRVNRAILRTYARDRDILDCFCYTGGFTLNAMQGNARSVLAVDSSKDALDRVNENLALNGFSSEQVSLLQGNAFIELRKLRDANRSFDLVILDPPKFAQTRSQVERASRGYKDINLLAFKLLRPGGLLFTFSCSGGINPDLFQKIVAGAALDAGVDAQIIETMSQAPDHPVALNFPEGAYLKGLVCRIN